MNLLYVFYVLIIMISPFIVAGIAEGVFIILLQMLGGVGLLSLCEKI